MNAQEGISAVAMRLDIEAMDNLEEPIRDRITIRLTIGRPGTATGDGVPLSC